MTNKLSSWHKNALIAIVGLSAMLSLAWVPAQQEYLHEHALTSAMKTALGSWKKPKAALASLSHSLEWLDAASGAATAPLWDAPVSVDCPPKQCSKTFLWELKRQVPLSLSHPLLAKARNKKKSKAPTARTSTKGAPARRKAPKARPPAGPTSKATSRASATPTPQASATSRPTKSQGATKRGQALPRLVLKVHTKQSKSTGTLAGLRNFLRPSSHVVTLKVSLQPSGAAASSQQAAIWKAKAKARVVAWIAILPPLLAIFFVLLTHKLLLSLLLSLFFGVLLLVHGDILAAISKTSTYYIWKKAVYQEFSFNIILFSLCLIGMVNVCNRNGGIQGLIDRIKQYASTARSSRLITAVLGISVFFDDYANSIVVGNTMRPLTDRYRVSREKLAYLVDSTAAPIAGIALLSTWIGYEVGLLGDLTRNLGVPISGYSLFLSSLPFRFYCWMTLIFLFMGVFWGRDFGPMLKAERRAWEEGKLMRDGATPLVKADLERADPRDDIPHRWFNVVIPVAVVLVAGFLGLLYSGGMLQGKSIQDALANANSPRVFLFASILGSVVAIGLSIGQGLLSLFDALRAWFAGARAILFAIGILVFAWSMGALSKDLGTAHYLIALLKSSLHPAWVPLLIFMMSAVISFATGTSWGTMGILLPTAGPLAFSIGGVPILILSAGAVLDGSIFGDHCSPLSDTTLFSSAATSCDHVDHVKTQAPYALTVMFVAAFFGYLAVAYGASVWVSILGSTAAFALIYLIFGKPTNPPRTSADVSGDD